MNGTFTRPPHPRPTLAPDGVLLACERRYPSGRALEPWRHAVLTAQRRQVQHPQQDHRLVHLLVVSHRATFCSRFVYVRGVRGDATDRTIRRSYSSIWRKTPAARGETSISAAPEKLLGRKISSEGFTFRDSTD
ncbi:hypothetical protein MHYP_G00090340 [Metynnis hypsauchen]